MHYAAPIRDHFENVGLFSIRAAKSVCPDIETKRKTFAASRMFTDGTMRDWKSKNSMQE